MNANFIRRAEAAVYLKSRYGIGSKATLAKLACLGGGPVFRLIGKIPVYQLADLDEWAQSRITAPRRSTSDEGEAA
jgi:hypothetical protein